ncbi:MAG: hypothetical protein EBX92_01015 [Actinobacteria bacterium]|nr:hypothetical protein [Actinomycetota bacterium]
MATVAIYGAGQLGSSVFELLKKVPQHKLLGVFGRADRERALTSKADVVIIATTTKFKDVAADIELAVRNGSHVLVSSEECAYPWAVDRALADSLDTLAKNHRVSIAGTGVNPGLIFDALVLTLLGAAPRGCTISVRRTVNISGFGGTVLRRLGMGFTPEVFADRVRKEEILGHAGFPQSMTVVADAMGLTIDGIDKELLPIITEYEIDLPDRFTIAAGESAGVNQTYTARVAGEPWFVSHFYGHVDLAGIAKTAKDEIELSLDGRVFQTISLQPGIGSQVGSKNMVANSIQRILAAADGWVTVAHLEPAFPEGL